MAETERDLTEVPSFVVARRIFQEGGDPELLRECILQAKQLMDRVVGHAPAREDNDQLADLSVFFMYLADALDPGGRCRVELLATPRKTSTKGGRRRLSHEEKNRREQAGVRAWQYYVVQKLPKNEAIERALADMRGTDSAAGLSSRIVERALDKERRVQSEHSTTLVRTDHGKTVVRASEL